MFRLFYSKKTQLPRADFVELMLSLQQELVSVLWRGAKDLFQPEVDPKILKFECEILSLCILSLSIPNSDVGLRNEILVEYCKRINCDNDSSKRFFKYLDMRCIEYYDAYNTFVKDHRAGGCVLGGVVANGLKGGKAGKVELDILKAVAAFSLFVDCLKSTLEFLGRLKKKYDLSGVGSVLAEKSQV